MAKLNAPVVPAGLRRPLAVVVAFSTVGLVVLAIVFAGVEGPGALDAAVDPVIRDLLGAHRAMLRRVVDLGSPRRIPLAVVALVAVSLVLRRPRVAVAGIAGLVLTALAVSVLQPAIGRTLSGGDALPSGHTSSAVAIAATSCLLLISLGERWPRAVGSLAALAVLGTAIAVAIGLVVNGLHYTTDTLAGLCTAVSIVGGTALLVDFVSDRLRYFL